MYDKRSFVEGLLTDANCNDWGGGDDFDTVLASKYAVVVARDEESWVEGAEDEQDVANVVLGCFYAEYYTEYVEAVWSVETGEQVQFGYEISITATVNGVRVEAGA